MLRVAPSDRITVSGCKRLYKLGDSHYTDLQHFSRHRISCEEEDSMKKTGGLQGWIVLAAAIALALSAVPASALEFGVRGYYWFPGYKADGRLDASGITGTETNYKDVLDVGNKAIPSVEAFAGLGKNHFSFMYTPLDYSGSTALSQNVTFKGKTFTAGTQTESDLKMKMYDFDYQRDLVNLENILAGFSVGVIGKIKYIDGETRMNAPALGFDEKQTYSVVMPMIGVGAHIGLLLNILEARAKVTGMAYSGNTFIDALADLSWTPFPFLDVHGGYRYVKLNLERGDLTLNSTYSGPFVALTVGF